MSPRLTIKQYYGFSRRGFSTLIDELDGCFAPVGDVNRITGR
jgi:hypothetical protein